MTQIEIANLKVKCLEIAQQIAQPDQVMTKAKELFDWCFKP